MGGRTISEQALGIAKTGIRAYLCQARPGIAPVPGLRRRLLRWQ